ncbi:MAG: hypothetical protein Q8M19_17200 [Reyranella sp.]|nr:hypothetical protein [Reyranella sp.]
MVDYLPAPKPAIDDFERGILARVDTLKARPEQLAAFVNGLILDGTARRPGLQSGLAPYMRLPAAEAKRITRARMADVIQRTVAAAGCITRDDLTANGFTDAEIAEHFTEAKRISRAAEMAV